MSPITQTHDVQAPILSENQLAIILEKKEQNIDCVSDILRKSNQMINLKYDHLSLDENLAQARKLGLLSGSK